MAKFKFKENTNAVIKKRYVKKRTFKVMLALNIITLITSLWFGYTLFHYNLKDLPVKVIINIFNNL